jgi:cytosine permease
VRWENVSAYVLGALVAKASDEWGWGIPPINGILVALVVAVLFAKLRATESSVPTPSR